MTEIESLKIELEKLARAEAEVAVLTASVTTLRTQTAKDAQELGRVQKELTQVLTWHAELKEEARGVNERLDKQTDFVKDRLGQQATVRLSHLVTCSATESPSDMLLDTVTCYSDMLLDTVTCSEAWYMLHLSTF